MMLEWTQHRCSRGVVSVAIEKRITLWDCQGYRLPGTEEGKVLPDAMLPPVQEGDITLLQLVTVARVGGIPLVLILQMPCL
jgi:hypothetical protein